MKVIEKQVDVYSLLCKNEKCEKSDRGLKLDIRKKSSKETKDKSYCV